MHALAEARSPDFKSSRSSIFVVEYERFDAMDRRDIQAIFRHRHILVLNHPGKVLQFDMEGLYEFGKIDQEMEVHGKFRTLVTYLLI